MRVPFHGAHGIYVGTCVPAQSSNTTTTSSGCQTQERHLFFSLTDVHAGVRRRWCTGCQNAGAGVAWRFSPPGSNKHASSDGFECVQGLMTNQRDETCAGCCLLGCATT